MKWIETVYHFCLMLYQKKLKLLNLSKYEKRGTGFSDMDTGHLTLFVRHPYLRILFPFMKTLVKTQKNKNVPSKKTQPIVISSTYLLSVLYYALLLFSRRRWCKATDLSLSSISRSFVSIDIALLRHQTRGVGDCNCPLRFLAD